MANLQTQGYAVLGARQIAFDLGLNCLGEGYEFVNLATLKSDLQDIAESLGATIGNIDAGYYDKARSKWYVEFTEYVSIEVCNRQPDPDQWFEGRELPLQMGIGFDEPASCRYADQAKGKLVDD